MKKLIQPSIDRNQVSIFNNTENGIDLYAQVELSGRWKIQTNGTEVDLYLEIKEKAFWTQYKYRWVHECLLRTIDDKDVQAHYAYQEFINECN